MLATPAYAQVAGGAGSAFASFVPLILIFAIMYFLLIRPQQKRVKEHKKMVEQLRRGDQVVTQGGLIGKVSKVRDDNEIEVELAEGMKVRVVKSTVAQVISKTEPASRDRPNADHSSLEARGDLGPRGPGAHLRDAQPVLRPGRDGQRCSRRD